MDIEAFIAYWKQLIGSFLGHKSDSPLAGQPLDMTQAALQFKKYDVNETGTLDQAS